MIIILGIYEKSFLNNIACIASRNIETYRNDSISEEQHCRRTCLI